MKKPKLQISICSWLSMICIIIGVMSWILFLTVPSLNIPGDKGFPIWLLTFIINPVGLILGLIALRKGYPYSIFLIIGNLVMTLSIYPIIIIGTLILGP
jgi:hypothetical protein